MLMRMDRQAFVDAVTEAREANTAPPKGIPANPVYLAAPGEVASALWTALRAAPLHA
jgi:NitT/TauT family transport system permease protein